ncbi:MAG: type II toxin-antitoxin system RelE/ParE family toxin [Pseudoflavonifractor sp.]
MQTQYSKVALKYLAKIDKASVERIKDAIAGLALKPPAGDIKPMEGYNDGRFRLRVGKYRVIFKYEDDNSIDILYIIDIGPRGDIYK